MREIKFRVWDKKNNKMTKLDEICFDKMENIENIGVYKYATEFYIFGNPYFHYMLKLDEFILMQYTGLKDKNGREVFEKDIVKKYNSIGIIEFTEGCFVIDWIKNPDCWNNILKYHLPEAETIGNKFEEPELLEK